MCLTILDATVAEKYKNQIFSWKIFYARGVDQIPVFEYFNLNKRTSVLLDTMLFAEKNLIEVGTKIGKDYFSYFSGFHTFPRKIDALKWLDKDDLNLYVAKVEHSYVIDSGYQRLGTEGNYDMLEVLVCSGIRLTTENWINRFR